MNDLVIDLRDVAKTYGRRVQALRGVQLQVAAGEIFGLLGPNGAGKSTLVKIMMTVVRPTRAEGTLLGRPLGHKPTLARVGYLPEHHRMPPHLTGRQNLEFFAALARVDRKTRKRRAAEMLELVRLGRWADARLRTYSKGMQQRLALAQALMNDPDLVVLDEPTDGLDPVGRKETRDALEQLRCQGKTVFLNSHLLGEVERLCNRVAILVDGKVVRQGTVNELTAASTRYVIEIADDDVDASGGAAPAALPREKAVQAAIRTAIGCELAIIVPPEILAGSPGNNDLAEAVTLPSGDAVELVGTTLRVATDDARRIQPLLDALRARNLVIRSVRPVRQSLEDFFIAAVSDTAPQTISQPGGKPT
jgi:ABC-2 type transport system ATP-binding protein